MKKFILLMTAVILLAFSKDDNPQSQNIRLYDKPLSVIKSHIEGNWQLQYTKGGFIANLVHHWDAGYWKFDFSENDKIKTTAGPISADTSITWIVGQDNYAGKTHIMELYEKEMFPTPFVIDSIYQDTVVLHINASDAMFFHFTKQ